MTVPLFDLRRQNAELADAFRAQFDQLLGTAQFVLGPAVEALEQALAQRAGAAHAVGLSSGTDALLAALMALNVKPGDEVVTTPFTWISTANVISRVGATPVFVDIDADTYNIDPARIAAAITPRTRAIIPVHLFGLPADMDAIMRIAGEHGDIPVIEDAAQSIDACVGERVVGSIGNVGCLSFYPTKNLAAMGDAGACVTNDAALADKLRSLRVHGQVGASDFPHIGGNFRIDALQAAMLSVKLLFLDQWTQARQTIARRYSEAMADLPVVCPHETDGVRHVYNQYTIRVLDDRRDALLDHLTDRKIGHRVYYPAPLHLQTCFAGLGCEDGSFPESERAAREVVSLPIFPELTPQEQNQVIEVMCEFFR
ncbi:MAG: DegT/DnrJ/EryC1/StrS family aminotransferase [Phycisphaeraceae bacterium]|nr:DegT/DnrJ/EryC1/StrS family aminotransferase [Phycisphaeraceae bacterium]